MSTTVWRRPVGERMSIDLGRPGRTHRRAWIVGGKAHIEVRAMRREGSESFARHLEEALTQIEGVHWAEANAVIGRVLMAFDGETVDTSDLVEMIESVEEAHGLHDERFGFGRPDFPGDAEPIQRAIVGLLADAIGIGVAIAGSVLGLPSLPAEAAALVSLVDAEPHLRHLAEDVAGPSLVDVGLGITNAIAQGLTQGPLGLVVDAAHRAGLLDESVARRASWARVEDQLHAHPSGAYSAPISRIERPISLPDGPIERYGDRVEIAAVVGATGALALTESPRQAASILFAGIPKAGRLGREAFSARLGHALASNDEIVSDPDALRRLDRIDTVVVDAAVLLTGQKEVDRVEFVPEVDHVEVQHRLRSLFDAANPTAVHRRSDWAIGPLNELALRATEIGRLRRRLGATPTHGLMRGDHLEAIFTVRDVVAPGGRALVEVARRVGHMIAIAGGDAALVDRLQAHMLIEGGEQLASSIRMLQKDERGVLLVCGPSPEALETADCAVGLIVNAIVPWGADVIATDLGTGIFLVEASAAARSLSLQSANLALAGAAGGALLGLALPPSQAASYAMTSVNVAALAAIANGMRAGIALARRPRPRLAASTPWHELEIDEVLALLGTTRTGLTASSAVARLAPVTRLVSAPARFAESIATELANPLTPVLAGGAAISAAVGSAADAVIVAGVTVLNGLVGGAVRYRAESAVRALDRSSQLQVSVLRGGNRVVFAADSLVPGDVISLTAGDLVPADCRILEANNLEVDESILTGESLPVGKRSAASFSSLISERNSMLYADTSVVAGTGLAVVVATGTDTEAAAGDVTLGPPLASGVEARLSRLTALSIPLAGIGGASVVGSGLLWGRELSDTLGSAVSLSVAAIPEGLPILATMAQLASARRLSKKGALVRNPRALEALARIDVLCTDKTGTLTGGRMTLTSVSDGRQRSSVKRLAARHRQIIAAALRATPPPSEGDTLQMTDRAIVEGGERCGIEVMLGAPAWSFAFELPFAPDRGYHATIGSIDGGHLLSVKGAPEVVLSRCERWRDGTDDRPIDVARRRALDLRTRRLTREGFRVLAVAECQANDAVLTDADVSGLTLLGFLALSDPVRPSASLAVAGLQRAGINVVMVTGDHANTAASVAEELGLLNGERVMTGTELAELTDDEFDRVLSDVAVFARVAPADKVRIVAAFQRAGHSVAMTGDGANDAPAMRLADVGLALGQHCATAARAAADIVVTDDRIETILDAVVEGRGMWGSVRDALGILLGGNTGEVLFTAGASALTGQTPLSTRQVLLVNLLTDVVPALAIAVRSPTDRSPEQLLSEGPDQSLSGPMYKAIIQRALTTTAGAGTALAAANLTGRRSQTNTVALVALVGTQLGQTLVAGRTDPLVIIASLGSAALLAAIVETPVVSQFFGCTPIGPLGWAIAAAASTAATGMGLLLPPAGRTLRHFEKLLASLPDPARVD